MTAPAGEGAAAAERGRAAEEGRAAAPWGRGDYFDLGVIGATHGLSDGFAQILVPVLALIVADFSLSPFQAGALLSLFSLGTFLLLPPLSMLADHTGRKKAVLIGGMGFAALSLLAIGWAPDFETMAALAFLAGAGNACYHPCGTALAAERFPAHRAFAISYHGLGGNVGMGIMPVVQAAIATAAGWRAAVAACTLPAFLLLPLV
ncbi:MAG: MFS transporter, partial [bacterium]